MSDASLETSRVVRAVLLGAATGLAFWMTAYVVIRSAVDHFRR